MTSQAEQAIARANKVMEEMGEGYDERLAELLQGLDAALGRDDRAEAALISHTMKGEAGMFGWPLVSAAAGWLRQILEAETGPCRTKTVVVHVDTIRLIILKGMKGEHPTGQKLIRELYQIVEKEELSN